MQPREPDEHAERAALAIRARLGEPEPDVFLTLGSGLSAVADAIDDRVDIPVAAVPGAPVSRAPGHPAVLRFGTLGGHVVLAQMGRVHLYEGYSASQVARMVDVAGLLGCSSFVVTNAAGGLRAETQQPGDIMVIGDHLNLTGRSPLTGAPRSGAPAFTDMAAAYDPALRDLAVDVGNGLDIRVSTGVYAGLIGPEYETAAEVQMLRTIGADAVGMSTVNEVIVARALGLRVLGISTLTNVHGPGVATSHDEILAVGTRVAHDVSRLVLGVLERL
ncbi:MAG TPA: purine-nucleoside phosphorylase [Nitriliruptorales bacterium]